MKNITASVLLRRFCLLCCLPLLWACDPFDTKIEKDKDPVVWYQAKSLKTAATPAGALKVMTYNIKFGAGRIDFFFDCFDNNAIMTEAEVKLNMANLAHFIHVNDPDVMILQEVDVLSKRAAYIDQAQWLLDNTAFNYGVYASQWRADFVPSDGVGRINSGNLILSKWKIEGAERIALPLVGEQDALTQYFYLRRNILKGKINVGGKDIHILNIHTDAYGQDDTRKKQLEILKAEMDKIKAAGGLLVAGGDFNTIPPGSAQVKGFSDDICPPGDFPATDFTEQMAWLQPFYDSYTPETPLADYKADNRPYFSFTADKAGFWNRKLDHLFTNGSFVPGSNITYQNAATGGGMETMPLSDHAPVSVRLKF